MCCIFAKPGSPARVLDAKKRVSKSVQVLFNVIKAARY